MLNCANKLSENVTGVILAGGQSRRMGYQNKGLMKLNDKPLCKYVIDVISPQVQELLINTNQNFVEYGTFGYPLIQDQLTGYLGPLAGIHSGLYHSKYEWVLVVSCDTPFLPSALLSQFLLHQKQGQLNPLYAVANGKAHPTILFIHKQELSKIELFLQRGERKLLSFLTSIKAIPINFDQFSSSFININTPEDLDRFGQLS